MQNKETALIIIRKLGKDMELMSQGLAMRAQNRAALTPAETSDLAKWFGLAAERLILAGGAPVQQDAADPTAIVIRLADHRKQPSATTIIPTGDGAA